MKNNIRKGYTSRHSFLSRYLCIKNSFPYHRLGWLMTGPHVAYEQVSKTALCE